MRVVIAEDLALLRDGLIRLLEAHSFTVVAAVDNGPDLHTALTELLTNSAKHAQATHAWVHINHGRQRLVITITDNGKGGAHPTPESGLSGIARRLDAFDGTMNITSPPGGPTIVTLEIPCALSSPKTLPSSATD